MSLKIGQRNAASSTATTTSTGKASTNKASGSQGSTPTLRLVASRASGQTGQTSATSATRGSSDSSATRAAARADEISATSAAAGRSRDAVGTPEEPAETHATGVDEAENPGLGDGKLGQPRNHPGTEAVGTALESGETGTLTNGNGEQVEFQVEQGKTSPDSGSTAYSVTVGDDQFTVNIPEGEDPNEVIARLTDFYSQQPENVRGAVSTINIEPGRNPSDEYWAEEYDTPGFTSAATGGGGTITFWNGSQYIQEGVFDHEFGHNIGSAVRQEQDEETGGFGGFLNKIEDFLSGDNRSTNIPRGSSEAARNDSISDYGDNAIAEDFAETWEAYIDAVEGGPEALEEFRTTYPERYALIVEEVLSRDLDVAA
jgi:hypothetical protein